MSFKLLICHVGDSVSNQEKPNYCNLILWGQKHPARMVLIDNSIKNLEPTFGLSKTYVTLTALKEKNEKILCAEVNGKWVRAVPLTTVLDGDGLLEIDCIDIGIKQLAPLSFLRSIPPDEDFLRSTPPLADRYVLADVVVEKNIKAKEPAIQYLKKTIENKMVHTVSLGVHNGLHGIRVYIDDNKLLAKVLVDGNMAIAAASYQEALGGDPSSRSVSPSEVSVKSTGSARSSSSNKGHYRASFLDPETDHVIVTRVENGPFKFTIQKKSVETEAILTRLREQMSKVELQPLVDTRHGVPCIVISSQDQKLYRGVIDERPLVAAGGPSVYFVDYGLSEKYDPNLTYEMPTHFLAYEALAYRVSLADASELKNIEGIEEMFSKLVLNKTLKCKVVDLASTEQLIHLYDEKTGRSIKDSIISKNNIVSQAKSCTPPTTLSLKSAHNSPVPLNPVRADLKVEAIQIDTEEDLFVTWAGDPGVFYGQLIKRPEKELTEISKELVSIYNFIEDPTKPIPRLYSNTNNYIGSYGVIRWAEDNNFYRVKVLTELTADIVVRIIDYGNVVTVKRSDILTPVKNMSFFTREPLGITCKLSPEAYNLKMSPRDWAELLTNQTVRVRIIRRIGEDVCQVSFPDCPLNRTILDALTKDPEETVLLADADASINIEAVPARLPVVNYDEPETDEPSLVTVSSRMIQLESSVMNEEDRSSNHSSTPIGPDAPSLNVFGRANRKMPIAAPAFVKYPDQPNLVGTTKALEVVHIVDPSNFYCQLNENKRQLDDLMNELASSYEDPLKQTIRFPEVGMACVAKYSADDMWYRAQIVRLIDEETIQVRFSDYGNEEPRPFNSIKVIEEEFLTLPPQAYHCKLSGLKADVTWTQNDIVRFTTATEGIKSLSGCFEGVEENGILKIRLMDNPLQGVALVINDAFGAYPRSNVPVPSTNYSTLPVEYKTTLDVTVPWHHSFDRFYLSPNPIPENHLTGLNEMQSFYNSLSPDEMVEDSPRFGLPCVVQFKDDKQFYRSRIRSLNGQLAKVVFVDYGNEQDTPLKELKRIVPSFLEIPQLAWECRLRDIREDSIMTCVDPKVHEDACFLAEGDYRAVFYEPDSDNVYPVNLKVPKLGDAASYLLKLGVGHILQPVSEDFVSLPPQKLDFTAGQTISTKALVPFVTSINEFWIQLDPEAVEDIMARIAILVVQPEFTNTPAFSPEVGKLCLAFFDEDERWYRARVSSIKPNGDVVVHYLDYGNTLAVKLKDLKEFPIEVSEKPASAIKCALDGGLDASADVVKKFVDIALNFEGTIKFVKEVGGTLHVRLFNPDDVNDQIGLITATPAAAILQQVPPAQANPVEVSVAAIPATSRPHQVPSVQANPVEVYIAHAESPDKFWIQLRESEGTVNDIQNKLLELDGERKDSFNIAKPLPGQLYAAIHPVYDTWYRATFNSVDNKGMAATQFVDYGDCHQVPLKDFRLLPEPLASSPPMGIQCSLSPAQSWPLKAVEHFVKNCSSEIVYRAVLGSKQDREGVSIQMVTSLIDTTSNVDFVDVLSSMMVTSPEDFFDAVETHNGGQQTTPEEEQVRHPVEAPVVVDVITYSPGQVISNKASVVTMTSPLAVWLQLDPSVSEALMERVSQYVSKPEFKNVAPLNPRIGDKCLALFSEDGMWYRALVKSVDPQTYRATIHYLDFGNEDLVHPKDLRPLPVHLMEPYPGLALKCALAGADRLPGASIGRCKELLVGRPLSVTVVNKDFEHLFVRLHDIKDGSDLNEKLGFSTQTTNLPAKISVPIPGEEVFVSHVDTPNIFWIQKKENLEAIHEIEKTLVSVEKGPKMEGEPKSGAVYAVKHGPTTKWLRARLLNVEGPCVHAHFLDIGDHYWVDTYTEILPCPPVHKLVPPLAVKCTFRPGVSADSNSEEVRKAFIDCTARRVCHAVFGHQLGDVLEVETLYAPGGLNVANHLASVLDSPRSDNSGGSDNISTTGRAHQQRGL